LPGSKGGSEESEGAGRRNDPNNVCTNEEMNKEKNKRIGRLFFITFYTSGT
jgi:hypothetical protein